ncbi:MAG: 2-oxoacid:acceptor oxidoreductase family protein, partial [Chloroflexi bacterium]|nr:2-oxoacid:acceptor oxidoreductase family protein [Chloroflexota bacterium]
MTTRIALDGVGGQGVRLIAGVMGALLARMGKQVTVLFDYDSSVRGSMSDAFLIFDDEPILNPVVEEADRNYVLDSLNATFDLGLVPEDIAGAYAGLRPLVQGRAGSTADL